MIRRDYLIVGAGLAGASVCEGIREHDKKGSILLAGNESALPYSRPDTLRAFLGRDGPPPPSGPLPQLDGAWFEREKVDLRLGTLVTQLDIDRHLAVLANGQAVEFRKACLATGSRVRRLAVAGAGLGNLFYLRTAADVLALREAAETETNLVVVGGGCIAAQSAALLSTWPKAKVSLVHRGKFLWNRQLDPETGAWLSEYFASRGVTMILGETLNGFEGRTVVRNVQTKSGLRVPAGLAVVALGVELNLALVANTPLSYPHGTPVNEFLETDEKGIFAVGDVAVYPDRIFGGVRRLDHWQSAIAQGHLAGGNLSGKKRQRFEWMPHRSVTVFDLQFDFVGDFSKPPVRVEIEGDRAKKDFALRCYSPTGLSGLLFCNQPAERVEAAKAELRARPLELKKR